MRFLAPGAGKSPSLDQEMATLPESTKRNRNPNLTKRKPIKYAHDVHKKRCKFQNPK
jgi:hypothetical protein